MPAFSCASMKAAKKSGLAAFHAFLSVSGKVWKVMPLALSVSTASPAARCLQQLRTAASGSVMHSSPRWSKPYNLKRPAARHADYRLSFGVAGLGLKRRVPRAVKDRLSRLDATRPALPRCALHDLVDHRRSAKPIYPGTPRWARLLLCRMCSAALSAARFRAPAKVVCGVH